jgi:hypothetical protein
MGPYYYPTKLLPPRGTPTPVGRVNIDDIIKTLTKKFIFLEHGRKKSLKIKKTKQKFMNPTVCVLRT